MPDMRGITVGVFHATHSCVHTHEERENGTWVERMGRGLREEKRGRIFNHRKRGNRREGEWLSGGGGAGVWEE
jgi:hypothetical protein